MPIENKHPFSDKLELHSPEAIGIQIEIAGIGARAHAFIIDWHIRFLLAILWLFGIGIALFSFEGLTQFRWENTSTSLLYIWLLPAGILYFFYHPVLEIIMRGKTPGKKMAGVKIVTLKGLTPDTGALLIRNVFRLIDSLPAFYILGIGAAVLTRHQVRIGDLAAGLVLIYNQEVIQKEWQKVSQLALNSSLPHDDQALLLDILKRWQQLQLDDRIRLGEKFLNKIGKPLLDIDPKKKNHANSLFSALEQLTKSNIP